MPTRAFIVALVASCAAVAADPPPQLLTGKVLPAAKPATGVVLDTGKELVPLHESAVSRMLFHDPALQNRAVELTLRERPGSAAREVVQVRTVKDGKRYEVFYFCHNCQLRANEPGPCQCCGGDTVLVEKHVPPAK